MIIQISSGQGPAECELAVGKLCQALKREYPDLKEISVHKSRFGDRFTSVMLETAEDLSRLAGTQQNCQRQPRPHLPRHEFQKKILLILSKIFAKITPAFSQHENHSSHRRLPKFWCGTIRRPANHKQCNRFYRGKAKSVPNVLFLPACKCRIACMYSKIHLCL